MSTWRERLLGYTGLFILFGIWTPMLWFVSSMREHYRMETFEVSSLHWSGIVMFVVLLAGTLIAQFGFVVIAQEHGELERCKREHSARS